MFIFVYSVCANCVDCARNVIWAFFQSSNWNANMFRTFDLFCLTFISGRVGRTRMRVATSGFRSNGRFADRPNKRRTCAHTNESLLFRALQSETRQITFRGCSHTQSFSILSFQFQINRKQLQADFSHLLWSVTIGDWTCVTKRGSTRKKVKVNNENEKRRSALDVALLFCLWSTFLKNPSNCVLFSVDGRTAIRRPFRFFLFLQVQVFLCKFVMYSKKLLKQNSSVSAVKTSGQPLKSNFSSMSAPVTLNTKSYWIKLADRSVSEPHRQSKSIERSTAQHVQDTLRNSFQCPMDRAYVQPSSSVTSKCDTPIVESRLRCRTATIRYICTPERLLNDWLLNLPSGRLQKPFLQPIQVQLQNSNEPSVANHYQSKRKIPISRYLIGNSNISNLTKDRLDKNGSAWKTEKIVKHNVWHWLSFENATVI